MPSSPLTFSLQYTLPRLPVPSLEETCAVYLKSLIPLQTPEEHINTKKVVQDFLASDLSKSLQQRLIDIDRASPTNWLEDNFWLKKAYLEWREPLMVNSNWYILGQVDAGHPKELLANNGVQPKGLFSQFQVRRAAHMIHRGLEYKEIIDRQELPVDMVKTNALCMWQYSRIFSVTRVPLHHCDTLVQADAKDIRHIIILLRNQIYKLNVYKEIKKDIWILLTTEEIESAILTLISHVEKLTQQNQLSPAISVLSSWQRDNWTVARNYLLAMEPQLHRANLTTIETALFAVALDDNSNGIDNASWTKTLFCGHQGLGNGHNRWFDKSFTLVVENNGMCGFSGEHSPVDALTVSYIFDYMLQQPVTGLKTHQFIYPNQGKQQQQQQDVQFVHLQFKTDATLDRYMKEAQITANATAALSDSNVLVFKEYGTDWIKKTGRVPPDAFYQMVLQSAYYRVHQTVTPTYETAATRKYLHGRTETIRTLSVDSKAFVEGFENKQLSNAEKYQLLVKATSAHRKYTQIASDGHGCDRHLLVLRLLNADHQVLNDKGELVQVDMHPIFTDPIYGTSQIWRLSTSGLHAGIRLMGTGFGTVYPDGYGINYMAAPTLVKFGIETKRVPETVSTARFMEIINDVLLDLKSLCEDINKDNDAKKKGGSKL